jgi:hypothetical protein
MTDTQDLPADGNDAVTNEQWADLFVGQPLDVYAYLQIPGNVVDDTQVNISRSGDATPDWAGHLVFATDYIGNFNVIYPNLTIPAPAGDGS